MPEQTPETGAPTRIALEDLIEAVSRGVTRAMLAEDDEVSGYSLRVAPGQVEPGKLGPVLGGRPGVFVGLWIDPSSRGPASLGGPDTSGLNVR